MLKKYATALEEREICNKTGNTWRIQDVPNLWRASVKAKIEADGYEILEDGTVAKIEE